MAETEWVLVPRIPTREMVYAWPRHNHGAGHERDIWSAMLAAAPKLETGGEIDEVMARAIATALRTHGPYISADPGGWIQIDGTIYLKEFGRDLSAALLAAGLVIVPSTERLLEKAEQAGISLAGQAMPATMETTLDPSNPNRHQLWPIDGGKGKE